MALQAILLATSQQLKHQPAPDKREWARYRDLIRGFLEAGETEFRPPAPE